MYVFLTKFLFHCRESQSKWFAKRGINWHISVGSYLKNGVINSHNVVHLFDNATQDAVTSNAILLDTLKKLHETTPMLKKAYIRSDNYGCFHSYSSVLGIIGINRESPISVSRVDFAHLKSTVAKYVNEGNDVRTASDFLADDVEVYEVEIVENFNTVLRLKPVVMGKEKLDDNADNVDQPAAMQPDDNQEAF